MMKELTSVIFVVVLAGLLFCFIVMGLASYRMGQISDEMVRYVCDHNPHARCH